MESETYFFVTDLTEQCLGDDTDKISFLFCLLFRRQIELKDRKHLGSAYKRLSAGFLLIVFSLVCVLGTVSDGYAFTPDTAAKEAYEAKLKEAKERKAELERSKAEQERLIKEYSQQKANAEEYITELDLKLNDISLRIFELGEKIENTQAELEQTQADLEAAKQREKDQYETMKARIRYIYENGETSLYEVLINGSGIEDVLNQLEYLQDIQKYDNSLLDRYIAAKESVEDHEHLLEATLEELTELKEQEEFDKATLDELYSLKAAEIENLTEKLGVADEYLFTYISEISSQSVAIEQIIEAEEKRVAEEEKRRKEEEERLRREEEARRLAEQRAAEAAKQNTTSKVYDKDAINYVVQTEETDPYSMIWPLPGDHRTYSKFGYRKAPTKGASTYHQGWDIGGEFGAPIVSVLAGTAEVVSYNSSAGNFVRVNHGGGLVTVYCHMSKQLVSQGEHVKQGQTIGLIGSTGVSTGPHLHFGVKVNDVYVDPNPYIGHLE